MRLAKPHARNLCLALVAASLLVGCTTAEDPESPRIYPALAEPEHKPIFHNEQIDAYQVRLQPGERSYYHLHSRDQLGISMADFTSANQVLGTAEQPISSKGGSISYIPHSQMGGTTHRVRALDDEMWVIGIEFAEPAPAGATILTAAPSDTSLRFPQGTMTRLVLAPGADLEIDGELLVTMNAGALQEKGSAQVWTFDGGALQWIGGAPANYTNNTGKPVELLLLDLD